MVRLPDWFKVYLLPILLYFLAAKLGALFNLAIEKASLVWLASGVAAVVFQKYGWKSAPALLVGGFLANLDNGLGLLGSVLLGVEALLQAVVFHYLMVAGARFKYPKRWPLILIGIACTLAGLTGALSGVAVLTSLGLAPMEAFGGILFTWWWGDSVGLFIIFKIVQAWQAGHARAEFLNWKKAGLFLVFTALSAAFFYFPPLFPFFAVVFALQILVFQTTGRLYSYLYPLALIVISLGLQQQFIGPFVHLESETAFAYKVFFATLLVSTEMFILMALGKLAQKTILILGSAWLLSGLTYSLMYHFEVEKEADNRLHKEENLRDQLTEQFQELRSSLEGGAALLTALDGHVTDRQWQAFVQTDRVLEKIPGLNGIGLIKVVPVGEIPAWERLRRQDTPERPFQVHPVPLKNPADKGPDSDQRYIISWIEPWETNQPALALDVSSEIRRWEAAEKARLGGGFQLTRSITLVQDKRSGPGFLAFLPLTVNGQFWGWVYAPIIADKFFSAMAERLEPGFILTLSMPEGGKNLPVFQLGTPPPLGKPHELEFPVGGQVFLVSWFKDGHSAPTEIPFSMLFASLLILMSYLGAVLFRNLESTSQKAKALAASMTVELKEANEKLKVSNEAKTRFLANMSHEIRTPIHGIMGLTSLLQTSGLNETQVGYLNNISTISKGLLAIVNDILDLTKIEAGKLELESHGFSLAELAENLQVLMGLSAEAKGLDFRVIYNRGEVDWVLGDEHRLRQVLINLCSNGVKFTHSGQVRLIIKPEDGGFFSFRVEDTGIGIGEENQARLFSPFTQGDSSTARKFGGTGLGLAISKQLVQLMGGDLSLDSVVGQGSVFSFRLPLPPAPKRVHKPDNRPDSRKSSQSWEILLVEDNPVNKLVAKKMLTEMGHRITTASDGREAVSLYQSNSFQLIFMDCQMPVVDGYQATQMIRESERAAGRPRTPIIALTAHSLPDERQRCLDCGMDDMISKPFTAEQLWDFLEKLMAGSNQV